MKLPAKVQTAVDVLTAFDVHPNLVVPLTYRLYLKRHPDTPPPLWGASRGYRLFLDGNICFASFIMVMMGFAYVLYQNNADNIIGALFNPVTQFIAWTAISLVSWTAISTSRDNYKRENANLGLPAWENFHANWRPDAPYVQTRADPRRYWLASLKGEPVALRAFVVGELAFVVLAFLMPNKVSSIAEVVSIVYLILCVIAYQKADHGKLMPEAARARNLWFIQNGFWMGFLLAALTFNMVIPVLGWPFKTSASQMLIGLICVLLHIMDRFRFEQNRNLSSRIEKSEQDKQIAEMRVQALKAQIEPHFIFNTLAHLKALIREDARAAEAMADDLSDFLRASTHALGASRVTLTEEGALATSYLELVKRRMGGRLSGDVRIDDDAALAQVPPWMILTLAENAVKHGIEPKSGAGRIDVTATRLNGAGSARLRITVCDDGVGFGAAQSGGSGVGLANVRERLQSLYGETASFTLRANTPSGVVAEITMPYETAGAK